MSNSALWQGFNHRWRNDAHPLSDLTSYLDDVVQAPNGGARGRFTAGMRHTASADVSESRAIVSPIAADGIRFINGVVEGALHGRVGDEATWVGDPIEYHVSGRGSDAVHARAVLRGFSLVCESAGDGSATRGFGVSVRDGGCMGGRVSFAPAAFIAPDAAPGAGHAAQDRFSYRVRIFYTVVVGAPDHVTFAASPFATAPLTPTSTPHAAGASVAVTDNPRLNRAAVAIESFGWRLRPRAFPQEQGRDLRHVLFQVGNLRYAPGSGQLKFNRFFWFTNEHGEDQAFSPAYNLDAVAIQYRDDAWPGPTSIELNQDVDGAVGRADAPFLVECQQQSGQRVNRPISSGMRREAAAAC